MTSKIQKVGGKTAWNFANSLGKRIFAIDYNTIVWC
jgi:hypothetical protein